ncbi:short chain dehydrogenase-like protein 17 [Elsinoe australis]|uniref:Short chain dehydrogenase-like protein 17 n=1 Tax=Elsinoe australis TaxID=40998 RepID=A0A4U7ATF8_9PEZI|nr:short chain dehydrogenase-like protein 17 [Elsinoe australis]
MPVPVLRQVLTDGLDSVPYASTLLKIALVLGIVYAFKTFFQGAFNGSERNMHGKVVMVTGGTSGIGEQVVRGLASRGAQIVLLTQDPVADPFLVEYIDDLRTDTANELITAEQVDLASLHSIRTFATKWIDNAPPRRLDMIVLCANTITPKGGKLQSTEEGLEVNWGINYLANFHLLSILSPALRAQPPDRELRVIIGSCVSYLGGELPVVSSVMKEKKGSTKTSTNHAFSPASAYASSKLALVTFAQAFQKHLSAYNRPDKKPMNVRVIMVDPGFTRTPGMRRFLTWGSLIGLGLYLVMYPFWWVVLKSPEAGAQSFLYAAMEEHYGRGEGGWLIKECKEVKYGREDVLDEEKQKLLWEYSDAMIQEAEKRGAKARAEKKAKEEKRSAKTEAKTAEPVNVETSKPQVDKSTSSRRSRKA